MAAAGQQGSPSAVTYPDRPPTLAEVTEYFQRQCDQWDSFSGHELDQLFRGTLSLFEDNTITQAVCLGLGNFTAHMHWTGGPEDAWYRERAASIHQLVFFTRLSELLSEKHQFSEIFFQDPQFTTVEMAFLQSRGYIVVQDPEAYAKLSSTTLIFAPRFDKDRIAGCFGIAQPAVFIGLDIKEIIEFVERQGQQTGFNRPLNQTLEHMLEQSIQFCSSTSKIRLPPLDNQSWVYSTHVHWIRDQARPAVPPPAGPRTVGVRTQSRTQRFLKGIRESADQLETRLCTSGSRSRPTTADPEPRSPIGGESNPESQPDEGGHGERRRRRTKVFEGVKKLNPFHRKGE